ncbi:P-loop containing nucleoside triphosphate hydrolase protein [Dipodascopsis tothii]|uniref:P-loop containing nucleoside triphosphate hydrolase protein n=1 Tax=Dipodascopsis tothii TaxID=44089 RepID=UPI0034CF4C6D
MATIYALSTPAGKSAVAVVRLSGPFSRPVLRKLIRSELPEPRVASLRKLYWPGVGAGDRRMIDHALTLVNVGPSSFTGEDTVEFHTHGSRAVLGSLLGAIEAAGVLCAAEAGTLHPVRYAEAGEFTRRAFLNGKMDLTQAEALGEVLDAETEVQLQASVGAAADGRTARMYNDWRQRIVDVSATLAAVIDFSEDGDFDESSGSLMEMALNDTRGLREEIGRHLSRLRRSEIVLGGIRTVLLGPPNAGKSSLLNALASRDAAIVSAVPGTTRDFLEVGLDIAGYRVVLTDTAGLRRDMGSSAHDELERIGVERARLKGAEADLVVVVVPADAANLAAVRAELDALAGAKPSQQVVVALNKIDMVAPDALDAVVAATAGQLGVAPTAVFPISCLRFEGIDTLTEGLAATFRAFSVDDHGAFDPISASARVQGLLEHEVLAALARAETEGRRSGDVVVVSEELRAAADGIGRITGDAVGVEEMLGVVFSRFCVGK